MKKLLVVDDEFIVRVGIRSIINWEEYGYTFVGDAPDGVQALEKIALYRPDIVLTDLRMENMDGFELISRCAAEYPEISFIALSSHNEFEDVRKAMKLGAKDYLFKPTLSREELLKTLKEIEGRGASNHGALDTVIRENLQAIKSSFLRRWVKGSDLVPEEINSQLKTLAPAINFLTPFVILYVSIDDFGTYIHGDTQFLESSMENTICQICSNAEVFSYEKGDIAVFFNTDSREKSREKVEEIFSKICEYCSRYLGLDVSGTVSPETDIAKTPAVFKICEDTMKQRTCRSKLLPYNSGQRNEIAAAREYIARHMSERVTVQDIAAEAGISEGYFSHLFKKETGYNVVDYINRQKIEKAASLLENPRVKVADAAAQVGIDNANYFSVIFRKVTGLSPQEYREKIKSAKKGAGQ
ncbi:MAG: response regulator [Treponema sp.]|nr:response regulator [Treponema sp.]